MEYLRRIKVKSLREVWSQMCDFRSLRTTLCISFLLSVALSPSSLANSDCEGVGLDYIRVLNNFENSPVKSNEVYKQLIQLKKNADKLRNECVRNINTDFKNELRAINAQYSNRESTKEDTLSQRTRKNSEISAATLERDRRLKILNVIPDLPEKPIKTKSQKLKP